jgi:hypothetical protein
MARSLCLLPLQLKRAAVPASSTQSGGQASTRIQPANEVSLFPRPFRQCSPWPRSPHPCQVRMWHARLDEDDAYWPTSGVNAGAPPTTCWLPGIAAAAKAIQCRRDPRPLLAVRTGIGRGFSGGIGAPPPGTVVPATSPCPTAVPNSTVPRCRASSVGRQRRHMLAALSEIKRLEE